MLRTLAVALALLAALPAVAKGYEVGVGDKLLVQVHNEPRLSGEVVVHESCAVTLPLVGRVEVCGLSVEAIEEVVRGRYAGEYLVDPVIAVRVVDFRSQRVDVLGEVTKRGPIYLDGRRTLVEVISAAGGPKAENVVSVEVTSVDGQVRRYDLHALTARPDEALARPGDTIVLRPGEVVFVEGQIKRPGAVTMSEGLTVTQALALAGGPDEFANLKRVLVRRADGSQIRVNVPRVHRGQERDVVLGPDDHLVVPKGAF